MERKITTTPSKWTLGTHIFRYLTLNQAVAFTQKIMKTPRLATFMLLLLLWGCSKDNGGSDPKPDPIETKLYFPPIGSTAWETVLPEDLGWNLAAETPLKNLLEEKGTDGFIILKNGKIAVEWYFGDFTAESNHSWNSAAKTLTAFTVGIAQHEGHLSLTDSSQDYLGEGWSSMTSEQEKAITIFNHLTMTTGLDYTVEDTFCTDQECLTYKNEPGTYWFYHNAAYTLLDRVVTAAVGKDFRTYFEDKIRNKIGMQGQWVTVGYNNLYFSNTRSMARFGLLALNKGFWDKTPVLDDADYFEAMTHTSQQLNKSYGYLWWLNGKDNYRLPGSETSYTGKLIATAPDDLIAGLGAFDQKLYVVPSQQLVVVRLGDDAGENNLASSSFDAQLWEKLSAYIQ